MKISRIVGALLGRGAAVGFLVMGASFVGAVMTALATPASAAEPDVEGLEEIVVTATRRETNLSNTPISLSALSATELVRDRVITMDDVSRKVPSLIFMPQSPSETYLSIRGTSTIDDSTGTDQGVNMFVDDVVRTGIADLQPDLYDMERIEVLKGPQGTLFGRNSLGGTLSLYTKNPTFKTGGSAEVSLGEDNLIETKGMFNTTISDDLLAARVAISAHSNGGYLPDPITNTDIGQVHRFSGRAKLLFTPNEELRIVGGFDYQTERGDAPVWALANFQPSLIPNFVSGPNQTSQADPGKRGQNIWGLNIRADLFQPIGTWTSITGYRHLNVLDRTDETGDPLNVLILQTVEHDRQFSEELRLASQGDQRLTWVAGIYYLNSDKSRPINGTLEALDCGAVCQGPAGGVPGIVEYNATQDTRTISYAGFIDANLTVIDTFKVDLGGRYTYEKKSGSAMLNHSNHFFGPELGGDFSHSWTAFTPKVTFSYKPIDALLAYATVSKGFQSGGFNTQGGDQNSLTRPFDSEYVWNYEAGLKFDGLNQRLQASASIFSDRYSNLQVIQNVTSPQGYFTATTNAGASKVEGLETDIQFAPARWLLLGLRYDFLTSKLTKYTIDNGDGTFTSYNGNEVPFIAKHRVTASVDFHTDLPGTRGSVAFGGDYSYRSSYYITPGNSLDTPSYITDLTAWRGLINLHASWTSSNERHEVAFFAQNLTNIHYALLPADVSVFVQSVPEFLGGTDHLYNLRPGPWQSIGITFREKF